MTSQCSKSSKNDKLLHNRMLYGIQNRGRDKSDGDRKRIILNSIQQGPAVKEGFPMEGGLEMNMGYYGGGHSKQRHQRDRMTCLHSCVLIIFSQFIFVFLSPGISQLIPVLIKMFLKIYYILLI